MGEELNIPDNALLEEETSGADEYTEIELEALDNGWSPEGAEGKRNLSAEEFMDRKPLYDEIHNLKRKTKKLDDAFTAMKSHQAHIRKQERDKAIAELNAQKIEAVSLSDGESVVAIDDQIATYRAEEQAEQNVSEPNEAFNTWVEDNTWYNQSSEMKEYADMIGNGYYAAHPEMSTADVYAHVSKEVKIRFPDKFENTARSRRNPVEGASKGRSSSKTKYSEKDLPDSARQIMNTLVRNGISKEQYLKDYFDSE